jgi:steroid 5-alpha reductase family enzyme
MSTVIDVILWCIVHGLICLLFLSSAFGMPRILEKQIAKQPEIKHYNQNKSYFWDKVCMVWFGLCAIAGFASLFIPNSFFRF